MGQFKGTVHCQKDFKATFLVCLEYDGISFITVIKYMLS